MADTRTDDYEDFTDDEDPSLVCPNCNGSGMEWEGWTCEYCEGIGTLDI